MTKRIVKIISITLVSIIGFFVLLIGGYVLYVVIQYSRIADNYALEIAGEKSEILDVNNEYTITTYNIGFGAYNHDFSFFMDTGKMKNGKKVAGKDGTAKSKEIVLANTEGAVNTIKDINPDFAFFQEVDEKADRSYKVNQLQKIKEMGDYNSVYAENFHSAYLFYPLNDPHGKTNAGIATLSKYKISSAVRRSFPVSKAFPTKFFDLDRCFTISEIPLSNGKSLSLINLHMSAYDKGGKIRAKQLEMLNEVLKAETEEGNYFIAGGDFNHDIANSLNLFPTEQEIPNWVFQLNNESLDYGKFAAATNAPTCRSTDMAYTKGVNYSVVIDGFIVSENIEVDMEKIENIDTDFKYSDHNPVKMVFSFK